MKKRCFKTWLKSKKPKTISFNLADEMINAELRKRKRNAWCKYGARLTNLCKTSPGILFQGCQITESDESYNHTKIINSKDTQCNTHTSCCRPAPL